MLAKACKAAVKGLLFVLIFCLLLYMVMCVMIFKQEDGTLPMRNYYDLPEDTVDVLFLGSSHIGMNVSTQILWDEYGMAGYKCWGSTQPIWNTYHYLKECLQYQKPKVVVVDVHGAIFSYEYADYVLQIKNTMGMRFSWNKVEAVMASAPQERWFDLLTELPTFHTRYNELTERDFQYFPWNDHSDINVLVNQSQDIVFPFDILDPDATEGAEPLAEKEEKYLRSIIELCREKNVPLELIAAPYQLSEFEQKRFRAVKAVAEEYPGLRFTNFNETYREAGIDPRSDFLDPGHFNAAGVPKYTRTIARLLQSSYDLPDRRLDKSHIWNRQAGEELAPAYAMTEKFAGDGKQDYIDTGVKLFDNMLDSWTVVSEFIVPPFEDEDRVIFACYDETVNQYQGLLVNMDENNRVIVRFSSYEDMRSGRLNEGDRIRLAVVKSGKTVQVFLNGEKLGQHELENLAHYDGSLLIGCQQAADDTLFRFSRPRVLDLQVYSAVLTETQIQRWEARDLPEPRGREYVRADSAEENRLYEMAYAFAGDGQEAYLDTGLRLYEDPDASWTILSAVEPSVAYGDSVYFACFLEDPDNYRGILVRRVDESLNIVYGRGHQVMVPVPADQPVYLAVVKDRAAYTIYVNGEKAAAEAASPCGSYEGTLLVGCERTADGKLFRFSGTRVNNLEVVRGLMTEEDILSWRPEARPEAPRPEGTPVEYRMGSGFAGDGKQAYLETGIQLYDVSDKSWWIHTVLEEDSSSEGTALSCFAEDPESYRGLLVRRLESGRYGLTLGTGYCTVETGISRTIVLDILKEGYHYRVYVNGEKQADLESRCRAWEGTLAAGAEKKTDGTPFRFSLQKIRELRITEEIPEEDQLRSLAEQEKEHLVFQK